MQKGKEAMSKIKPARGYCLIEPIEADEVSAGGVILPDRVKDMPQRGKVLAVGEAFISPHAVYTTDYSAKSFSSIPLPCKVGDTVIFKRFVDNKIKEEGKELLLVRFEDIIATYG